MKRHESPLAMALRGIENAKNLRLISEKLHKKPLRFTSAPKFNFTLMKPMSKYTLITY